MHTYTVVVCDGKGSWKVKKVKAHNHREAVKMTTPYYTA